MDKNIAFKGKEKETKLFTYLVICFTLSWIIVFTAILSKNNMVFSFAKIIIMFVPLLSVMITCKSIHLKSHAIHLKVNIKANWKYLFLASVIPLCLVAIVIINKSKKLGDLL